MYSPTLVQGVCHRVCVLITFLTYAHIPPNSIMSYNSTVHSAARACKASRRAVIELINSKYTLGHTQTSCIPILRYMALAYCYDIRYVIVGQNPYPTDIVPHFGSAYSQCDNSVDTPTTRIICEHFDGSDVNDVYVRDISNALT